MTTTNGMAVHTSSTPRCECAVSFGSYPFRRRYLMMKMSIRATISVKKKNEIQKMKEKAKSTCSAVVDPCGGNQNDPSSSASRGSPGIAGS